LKDKQWDDKNCKSEETYKELYSGACFTNIFIYLQGMIKFVIWDNQSSAGFQLDTSSIQVSCADTDLTCVAFNNNNENLM
jgi:hypothetical protein